MNPCFKKVKFEVLFNQPLTLTGKGYVNLFLRIIFEELVFFDLWTPNSGFVLMLPMTGKALQYV